MLARGVMSILCFPEVSIHVDSPEGHEGVLCQFDAFDKLVAVFGSFGIFGFKDAFFPLSLGHILGKGPFIFSVI